MKKPRLNLELDFRTKDRIDRLKKVIPGASITEVIRRALRLYDEVTLHTERGGKLIFRNRKGEDKEVILL